MQGFLDGLAYRAELDAGFTKFRYVQNAIGMRHFFRIVAIALVNQELEPTRRLEHPLDHLHDVICANGAWIDNVIGPEGGVALPKLETSADALIELGQ